jgi:long-chain fatty acid transport protein
MINKLRHVTGCAVTLAIIAVFGLPQVFALGFRNPDQDARATGQGEAFVAQADDASAVYYNPGGLTQIQGTEITCGGMVDFPDSRLKGTGSAGQMNTMALLPHLYVSTDFGMTNSPWRVGLGFNVPFGNQADYAKNGPFKYIITSASLAVFNIEPTVAYKFNDHLSLGAGLNVYEATTDLRQHVNLAALGAPDGQFHFYGDGLSFGATAGLMWKITPQHTVGVVYRSPFSVEFDGNASLNTVLGLQAKSAHSTISFPQSVSGGYAFRPTPKLKLEVDVEWTNWQPLHSVVVHAPGTSFDGTTIPFQWQDSFFYEFGVQYDIDSHWTVRGGYIYSENTVPNTTFSPTVPDYIRHVFSAGLGYALSKRCNVDLVYQFSLSPDRTVNNGTAADGTWESHGNAVAITSSVKF